MLICLANFEKRKLSKKNLTLKTAYISLGSNLGDRYDFFIKSINLIEKKIGRIIISSSIYETDSWGFKSKTFLNACIGVKTMKNPSEILDNLINIEMSLGRERKINKEYQDRFIDLDLLFYGDKIINSKKLKLPHPRISLRKFILKPLSEIAGEKIHPVSSKTIFELLQDCQDKNTVKKFNKNFLLKSNKKFLAIEGNIGVGKTSLVKLISKQKNCTVFLEKYSNNRFIEDFYENKKKFAYNTENEFFNLRVNDFEKKFFEKNKCQNIISDFSIYKSLIFAKQNLNEKDFIKFNYDFKNKIQTFKPPDLIIFLKQKNINLINNIKKRNRSFEKKIDISYLKKIENGYLDFFNNNKFIKVFEIDLSNKDFIKKQGDLDMIIETINAVLDF